MKKIILPILLASGTVTAGGLNLPDVGTAQTTAMAGTNKATNTKDASTAQSNPAAMTALDGNHFSLAATGLFSTAEYRGQTTTADGSSVGGGDGGNLDGWGAIPSFYYVHSVSDDFKLGLSVISSKGGSLNMDEDWQGRYTLQELNNVYISTQLSMGYKINDKLSIGASLVMDYSELDLKAALPNLADSDGDGSPDGIAGPDGQLHTENDDIAFGYKLGLTYDITDDTRLGIVYHSEMHFHYNDKTRVGGLTDPNLGPVLTDALGDINADLTLPQSLNIGLRHQFTDKLALTLSLGWEDWSEFGDDIRVSTNAASGENLVRKTKDTYHIGLGAEYQLDEKWLLMAGFRYDTSAYDEEDRTLDFAVTETYRIGLGAEYRLDEKSTIGLGYCLTLFGENKFNDDGPERLAVSEGELTDMSVHLLTVSWNYQF